MPQTKLVKTKSSGCCWKKLFGKAFNRRDSNEVSRNIYTQDEIIHLNLYLTTLEKKMQAIEEVTRLKWYRKEVDSAPRAEGRTYIRSGFRYLTDMATANHFLDEPFNNQLLPAGQFPQAIGASNSHAIIKEIMSLGNNTFDYESRKWNALISPPVVTEQESVAARITELESTVKTTQHTARKYHVGALSYPVEIHAACSLAEATLETPGAPLKASCIINYFDVDNKTIEITYDNKDWDKRGTIVLKDIENQTGVQAELIGRVVCFLLGMGEVDLV